MSLNGVEIAVRLSLRGPDDDEIAIAVHCHRGRELIVGGDGVDAELAAGLEIVRLGRVVTEPFAVDSPTAVGVFALAGPYDHEIAVGVHRHRGFSLIARREGGVDQRFVAQRVADAVEEPHVDVGRAVGGVLEPYDGVVALVVGSDAARAGGIADGIHAGGSRRLHAGRGLVDENLGSALVGGRVAGDGDRERDAIIGSRRVVTGIAEIVAGDVSDSSRAGGIPGRSRGRRQQGERVGAGAERRHAACRPVGVEGDDDFILAARRQTER